MFKRLLLLICVASPLATCADAADAKSPILQLLARQVADWNRGDIRAFMSAYEYAETTTFVGKEVLHGYRKVMARYLEQYPSSEKMGQLTFSDLEERMLGRDYATVIGKFHLSFPHGGSEPKHGVFTLILRNTPKGWRIIQDHTS